MDLLMMVRELICSSLIRAPVRYSVGLGLKSNDLKSYI